MVAQHILIVTSDTGGGHRSAAFALENSLTRIVPGQVLVKMTQALEESNYFSKKAAELYNFLLRDHQNLMKYYFWLINQFRPNESQLVFKNSMSYGVRLFERMMPSLIVSVHPMTQHFFAYLLKRLHLQDRIPLLTVVTDPYHGFWKGWACKDVKCYYVASESAKWQLIEFGVDSHKIQVMGMPVHSKFHPVLDDEKRGLKESLGLDPERFTVFFNAGWIGGGNIPQIFQVLTQFKGASALDIQVVFLTGRNERLVGTIEEMIKTAPFLTKLMGYTPDIEQLMNASDVMVSKLGALTTFEALSCHLPIIADSVTPPMPQEMQTAAFLEETGTGILLKRPEEIVSVLKSLLDSPSNYQALKDAVRLHSPAGAADRIAQDMLCYLPNLSKTLNAATLAPSTLNPTTLNPTTLNRT